jgi:hypothetical protein
MGKIWAYIQDESRGGNPRMSIWKGAIAVAPLEILHRGEGV